MTTAFQSNAFQNNAFQIDSGPIPVITIDGHDGDRFRKRLDEERRRSKRKREDVLAAYEFLVEGKSPEVAEIVEPFTFLVAKKGQPETSTINFDKFIADLDAVEQLWQAYIEMDDMDVIRLLM